MRWLGRGLRFQLTKSVMIDSRLDIVWAVFNDVLDKIALEIIDGVVVGLIVNLKENYWIFGWTDFQSLLGRNRHVTVHAILELQVSFFIGATFYGQLTLGIEAKPD